MIRLSLNKKYIIYFIKIIIGLGLYLYLLINNKINFSFFVPENSALLILLFSLQIVMFGIGTLRWYIIGRHSCEMGISLLSTAYISWVAQFFATFTPSTIGTDVSRIFYVGRSSAVSQIDLIKITIIDRLCGLLSLIVCSLLGVVFYFLHFSLPVSILSMFSILILAKIVPTKNIRKILLRKDIHLPPFSAIALSFLNFTLKAFSIFIIIYFVSRAVTINDFYICLGSQLIEGLAILPANIGMGHILFNKALSFIQIIDGAQIYNVYFSVKVLFKLTGFAGWLLMRGR